MLESSASQPHAVTSGWANDVLLVINALTTLVLAEVITSLLSPVAGMLAYAGLLVLYLSPSALTADRRRRRFLVVLGIVPILRISSLALSTATLPSPIWYLFTTISTLIAAASMIRILEISPGSIGLQLSAGRGLALDLAVAASGPGIGALEWLILRPVPAVNGSSIAWIMIAGFVFLVAGGFVEELVFRGLIQSAIGALLQPSWGLVATSVLYGMLQVGWHSLPEVLFALGAALYFGVVIGCTRSLLGVSLAHGAVNVTVFIVLPLSLVR